MHDCWLALTDGILLERQPPVAALLLVLSLLLTRMRMGLQAHPIQARACRCPRACATLEPGKPKRAEASAVPMWTASLWSALRAR